MPSTMLDYRKRGTVLLIQIAVLTLVSESSWINKYFRVQHRAHYKLNFNCKNITRCSKPAESEEYLATVLWPKSIRKYASCMDYECVCPAYNGTVRDGKCKLPNGQILGKVVRKEYRQMTTDEREAYVQMMNDMQKDGNYKLIGTIHQAAGIHSGPSFFPWHREFLKRTEFIFRLYNHTLFVPYWDSVLDSYLPAPADSIFFSKFLMGETDKNGDVYESVFKNFTTMDGRPTFNRQLANEKDGEMISNTRIDWVLQQTNISRVLAYSMPLVGCEPYAMDDRFLEYTHDYVHYFIDGDMRDRTTSSNDPIFFSHHSFIDSIWESWRQRQQTTKQRENDYPADILDCCPPWHFKMAKLVLLQPFRNIDALSNKYTDNLAEYAPRPSCTNNSTECRSEFLWCDTLAVEAHCVSKIKLNGNCTGFEWSKEACYEGRCIDGKCRQISAQTAAPQSTESYDKQRQQRLKQKTKEFYKKKLQQTFKIEIVDVKELSRSEKISRFM